ncbi:MAG: hypothetical protein MZV70_67285 [Desulfobacterales bacterium]|nr:hypothetical protein [Desulfobacterales bacterium]
MCLGHLAGGAAARRHAFNNSAYGGQPPAVRTAPETSPHGAATVSACPQFLRRLGSVADHEKSARTRRIPTR